MSDEDIYTGSRLSKIFGFLAFVALLFSIEGLLRLDWGQVVISLIIVLLFSYVGYGCAGGCRNPNLYKQENEGGKLWSRFKGMANTDEILIEKAKTFAPFLFDEISGDTKSLFEALKKDEERKIDEKKIGEVFFEMLLFNLHYVDRSAFSHLGAEKRNVFMDTMLIEFVQAMSITHDRGIEEAQFCSSFVEAYEERGKEYEKYKKSFPEKNEGTKDTLFWEFGKKIARVLGLENDAIVIMCVTTYTFTKYKFLELPELLNGKK